MFSPQHAFPLLALKRSFTRVVKKNAYSYLNQKSAFRLPTAAARLLKEFKMAV